MRLFLATLSVAVTSALAGLASSAQGFCVSCYPPPASGCNEWSEVGRVVKYASSQWRCGDHYFIDHYGRLHVRIYWDWIGWA